MSNLRDRGYPSAKSYRPNKSDKKNTPMTGSMQALPVKAIQRDEGGTRQNPAIDKLLTAYNSRAFGNPNMPLINKIGVDYVTDDTDDRAYMSGFDFRNREGDRLGFVHSDVAPTRTGYYAGIDNLPFGENYFDKEVNTPLGTFGAEYDGDGTASLSYKTSPNVYYLKALANLLMNRGTL